MARCVLKLPMDSAAAVQKAAHWLARFYPEASATVDGHSIKLQSETLSTAQLERIWHVALLNELQWTAARAQRREVLQGLVQ
jgi:hypothetical protein